MEVAGRCNLSAAQSAALWRSKIAHIAMLPVMTVLSTVLIQFQGAGALQWVFLLLLAAGLVEEFGGSANTEEAMVNELLTPHVVSCNASISACEKGKEWEGALALLQEMVL